MSDAQETDARQNASVLRALEEEGNTPASARSYAAQSSEQLDPRYDLDLGRFESSHFECVPVTTYRQVYDIQASQAFMLGSALDATRGDRMRLLESMNVEIWGGAARSIGRDLEATPVSGYSGAVTSASEGNEEALTSVGHLPAEGRDPMLKCRTRLAERGLGIGQLRLRESLRSGLAEYFLTFQICKWGSGNTSISVAGGALCAVGLIASKGCCRPAEDHDDLRRLGVVWKTCCKKCFDFIMYVQEWETYILREQENL